jgi:hypothetical protein
MESTKESDLVTAVLMYAMRCLAEGDQGALHNMNFGPQEIETLREMTLADLYRVASLRAHCLAIRLNRRVYWPMIDNLRQQRASEELQQTLIAADAPQEMLQTLFGLGPREYTRYRRMLSVDPSVGRPPEPDEESAHRLWAVWKEQVGDEAPDLLEPEVYLDLYQETGLSMRAIWSLTQQWSQYGNPAVGSEKWGPEGASKNGTSDTAESSKSRITECAD